MLANLYCTYIQESIAGLDPTSFEYLTIVEIGCSDWYR